nr:glycosyltransferase family 4 protein [Myxococcota bacterium]
MKPGPPRPGEPGPRLAVIGAFAFPYHQGSQLFLAGQARALADAGARPSILCYGRGVGDGPEGIERISPRESFAPRALGSGLHWGKPLADAALLAAGRRAARRARQAGRPFDFVLAHNAEAAAIALASRRSFRAPVVYVAHTLWRHELSAYLPAAWTGRAEGLGGRIDRFVARHADGVIALAEETRTALGPDAASPVAVIPPGFEAGVPPSPPQIAEVC